MTEHLIRLRGGWIFEEPGRPPRRVSLPAVWPPELVTPFRLIRHFQRPPIDPLRETLHLQLDGVAGLLAVRLNDVELAGPIGGRSDLALILDGPLPASNVLVLDVDPSGWKDLGGASAPWGAIALVIGSS